MYFEAKHISKIFGNQQALSDVSIDIQRQSIFGLLGPNGAGKSTLLRIMNCIIAPDTGSLWIDGRPMMAADVEHIGYLPEERGLYKRMKVSEQIVYLAQLKGLSREEASLRMKQWLRRLEIETWCNRRVEELSKGMQQKVQFITTVLHRPQLLIFDEPFSGFDPVNADMLRHEILRLRDEGATVILSTHNMASVEEICDDIALINQSHLVLQGSVKKIRERYRQNSYEVVCRPLADTVALPSEYRITLNETADGEQRMHITVPDAHSGNDLVTLLLPQTSLLSFHELLPSMNDIFIETVKGDSNE